MSDIWGDIATIGGGLVSSWMASEAASDAASSASDAQISSSNAATNYQNGFISNAAFGLVTKGYLKGLPKSMAVEAWINSIWALYYERKPLVTYEWNASLYDFSTTGPMPCSVPDLMEEVYA